MVKELTLLDIIERNSLQELLDAFAKATGMAAVATDIGGTVTVPSCPVEFRSKYSKLTKNSGAPKKIGMASLYTLHGGLVEFAVPVTINGKQLATLTAGQVLTAEPDLEKAAKTAEDAGLDSNEYVELLGKVKVVTEEQLSNAAELLYKIAQIICEAGYAKITAQASDEEKSKGFTEVRETYSQVDEKVAFVSKNIKELSEEFDTIKDKTNESAKIVEQTDSILKYIQNVATQMTLLGFNASIEAKHVGEAGAGFNIIAQEVRQLAEQTSNQTRNVEEVLTSVRASIRNIEQELQAAVDKVKANITAVEELREIIADTTSKMNKII